MNNQRTLHWPLIAGLGILALVRPLTRIIGEQAGTELHAIVPAMLTVLVSIAWILIVGLSRNRAPLLTLLLAGVAYAVFAIALSGILSPVLNGQLEGPLANPIGIVPMLILNAAWGLAAGAVALLLQRARGQRGQGERDPERSVEPWNTPAS